MKTCLCFNPQGKKKKMRSMRTAILEHPFLRDTPETRVAQPISFRKLLKLYLKFRKRTEDVMLDKHTATEED